MQDGTSKQGEEIAILDKQAGTNDMHAIFFVKKGLKLVFKVSRVKSSQVESSRIFAKST